MGGVRGGGLLPGGPIATVVIISLFAITLIVLAIAFYRLFRKAGFAGALGLLMLVPPSIWAWLSTLRSRTGLFSPRSIGSSCSSRHRP